jgi:hypothetical protein
LASVNYQALGLTVAIVCPPLAILLALLGLLCRPSRPPTIVNNYAFFIRPSSPDLEEEERRWPEAETVQRFNGDRESPSSAGMTIH